MRDTRHPDLGFARGLDLARESDVRKGVRAYARTLERHPDFYFNEEAAVRAILFFPQQCRLTKGPLAGRPLVLQPWQAFEIVAPVHGWRADDGTRRYRRVQMSLPRKNGATELIAAMALQLVGDAAVPDVVLASACLRTRADAFIVLATARAMLRRNADLARSMRVRDVGAFIDACRSSDGSPASDRTLVVVYAADQDDDPWSPETWAKANPSLGVTLSLAFMRESARRARSSGLAEQGFKMHQLNVGAA